MWFVGVFCVLWSNEGKLRRVICFIVAGIFGFCKKGRVGEVNLMITCSNAGCYN